MGETSSKVKANCINKLLRMVFPAKALSVSCLKMEIRRFLRSVKVIEPIWQAFHLEGWRRAGKGVGLPLWDLM